MGALRSILVFLLISMMAVMGLACSRSESPSQTAENQQEDQQTTSGPQVATTPERSTTPATEPAQAAQQAPGQELSHTMQISGLVEETDDGIVIVTDLGKYSVQGQDLSSMIGKTVKVTGAVKETAGQYTIDVLSVSESE